MAFCGSATPALQPPGAVSFSTGPTVAVSHSSSPCTRHYSTPPPNHDNPAQRLTQARCPGRAHHTCAASPHTFKRLQDDTRMVIGDDIGVAVLRLVGLQVRMFPGELLPRVDRLQGKGRLRLGRVRGWIKGLRTSGAVTPAVTQLTSYSCESLRLSLALSLSMCSAMSAMGMGGWLSIPARR